MSFKNYIFLDELNALYTMYKTKSAIERNLNEILSEHPYEDRYLYRGKPYVFSNIEKSKELYDANPYVISLGPTKNNEHLYYCLNLHYIPYKIRVSVVNYIYNSFSNTIDAEIGKYPYVEDSKKQASVSECTISGVKNLARQFSLMQAIHKYDIKNIQNCKCINYNKIHWMVCSDANTFANGTINDAQRLFFDSTIK